MRMAIRGRSPQRLTGTGSKSYWPGAGNNEEVLRGNTSPARAAVRSPTTVVLSSASSQPVTNGVPTSIVLSLADTPLCKVARK
jgi:hypothetical protein